MITENYITTITVFDHEQLSFGNEIKNPDGEQLNVTYKMSKGTVLLRRSRCLLRVQITPFLPS